MFHVTRQEGNRVAFHKSEPRLVALRAPASSAIFSPVLFPYSTNTKKWDREKQSRGKEEVRRKKEEGRRKKEEDRKKEQKLSLVSTY